MDVFVFPIMNVTLFPSTTKPLNVFEPKYIAMIKESVRTKTPVALAFVDDPLMSLDPNGFVSLTALRDVAGYGMPIIVDEKPNGSLMVMIQGMGKAKLKWQRADVSKPFMVCEADVIEENNILLDRNIQQLAGLFKVLRRWVHHHIPDPMQREMFLSKIKTPPDIVGHFAAYLVRDYDLQQWLLEENNINLKVNTLVRLLESNELAA